MLRHWYALTFEPGTILSPVQVVACTHYNEILAHPKLKERDALACYHMKVAFEDKQASSVEDFPRSPKPYFQQNGVVPLFKVEPGISESSFAIECAASAGVHQHVVNRAKEVRLWATLDEA